MSEIIPSHIGSRLADFSSDASTEAGVFEKLPDLSSEDLQNTGEPNEQGIGKNLKKGLVMQRKKKAVPKANGKKKRTNGVRKSLPTNPGATADSSSAIPALDLGNLDDEDLSGVADNVTPQVEEVVLPDLEMNETAEQDGLPDLDLSDVESTPEPVSAKSVKPPVKRPAAKKKRPSVKSTARKSRKPSSTSVKATESDIVKPLEETASESLETITFDQATSQGQQEVPQSSVKKPVSARKKPVIRKSAPKADTPSTVSAAVSENSAAAERKAYVQKIKTDTQAFLAQLAAERRQREVEYAEFRQSLREDLGRK